MSAEKIIHDNEIHPTSLMGTERNEKNISNRVDINVLINRIRLEKQKENKLNFVFFGVFVFTISLVGIFVSL